MPFVPPWEMPQLLNQLDAVFIFESGLPHFVVSNVGLEAIGSGIGIITDRVDFTETYRDIMEIDKNQVIVVTQHESSSAAEITRLWVEDLGHMERQPKQQISYQEYMSTTEDIFADVISGD